MELIRKIHHKALDDSSGQSSFSDIDICGLKSSSVNLLAMWLLVYAKTLANALNG